MSDGWPGFGHNAAAGSRRGPARIGRRPTAAAHVELLESRSLLALVVGPISAAEGVVFRSPVATFAPGDVPVGVPADYHATINWGDGSAIESGTIRLNTTSQRFEISGAHAYAAPGSYPVTVVLRGSSGSPVTGTGLATVSGSTLSVTGQPIKAQAGVPFNGVVATVLDSNPTLVPASFVATIDWGDGTPVSAGTIGVKPGGGGFNVVGTHTYLQPASPVARVTVTRAATGQFATGTFAAAVASPGLSLSGVGATITPTAGVPFRDVVVATFRAQAAAPASDFVATIDWGDGQTTAGMVVSGGGTLFRVLGSHVYGNATTWPIKVTLIQTTGVSSTSATVAGSALAQAPAFTGRLDPLSDTGPSNHDGITRLNRLKFSGTARPFSLVQLYSRLPSQLGPVLLGQATAGGDGAWAVFAGPLLDGRYTITATVTPPDGTPLISAALPPVTIDTVAPQVTLVRYTPAAGTIVVGFRDDRSGMDLATVIYPGSYSLIGPQPRRPGSVRHPAAVTPAVLPANANAVLAVFRSTLPRNRLRSLQILAGGIADVAGNPLKGANLVTPLGARARLQRTTT